MMRLGMTLHLGVTANCKGARLWPCCFIWLEQRVSIGQTSSLPALVGCEIALHVGHYLVSSTGDAE